MPGYSVQSSTPPKEAKCMGTLVTPVKLVRCQKPRPSGRSSPVKISRHGSLGQREPRSSTVVRTPARARRSAATEAPKPEPMTMAVECSGGSGSGRKISGTHSRNRSYQNGAAPAGRAPEIELAPANNAATPAALNRARLRTRPPPSITHGGGRIARDMSARNREIPGVTRGSVAERKLLCRTGGARGGQTEVDQVALTQVAHAIAGGLMPVALFDHDQPGVDQFLLCPLGGGQRCGGVEFVADQQRRFVRYQRPRGQSASRIVLRSGPRAARLAGVEPEVLEGWSAVRLPGGQLRPEVRIAR